MWNVNEGAYTYVCVPCREIDLFLHADGNLNCTLDLCVFLLRLFLLSVCRLGLGSSTNRNFALQRDKVDLVELGLRSLEFAQIGVDVGSGEEECFA